VKIGICVCTYRRPDGLRNLLEHIAQIDSDHDLFVAVADNDQDRKEGIAVAESMASAFPWALFWQSVAEKGISHSRNLAAQIALPQKPDMIAFLDDDEWPSSQWLDELLRVQAETNADAVGGPTVSVFPDSATEKQRQNAYFGADLGLADGSACQLEAAGNFLVKADVLHNLMPSPFDPQFALSGGEDLAFFMRLRSLGCKMHWAANAIVSETVTADRLTPEWMQHRVMVIANSRVHVMRTVEPGVMPALIRGGKTIALCAHAAVWSMIGLVKQEWTHEAKILRWKFWGKFTAHMRHRPQRAEGR